MEVSALSGQIRAMAGSQESSPTSARKDVQREASVERTRENIATRDERSQALHSDNQVLMYRELGRSKAPDKPPSNEAIDLFSAHQSTDFNARTQLAAGNVIDTSQVRANTDG